MTIGDFFKILSKLGIDRSFINLIKIICKISVANIIFNSEILKAFFSLIVGTIQIYLISPLLFSIKLEVLAGAITEEK